MSYPAGSLRAPELPRGLEIQEQETQVHVAGGKGFVFFPMSKPLDGHGREG